jgi:hypothetical protein
VAERLVAEEIGAATPNPEALAAEDGLTIEEDPAAAALAVEVLAIEDGLAAADAAAAGLSVPGTEVVTPPAEELVLNEADERYLRGPEDPNRGLSPEELKHLDDWDDQTAADQENLPEDEQQG